ncbi:MAG: hypothetical protein VX100_07380 [Pseudomonadota bacterium]|nr:hypothetical protein [Pseudomonadota bacterium]
MKVYVDANICISGEKLLESMTPGDVSDFLNALAIKIDSDFVDRHNAASDFADHLSEIGARFLAEIVAHRHARLKD